MTALVTSRRASPLAHAPALHPHRKRYDHPVRASQKRMERSFHYSCRDIEAALPSSAAPSLTRSKSDIHILNAVNPMESNRLDAPQCKSHGMISFQKTTGVGVCYVYPQ